MNELTKAELEQIIDACGLALVVETLGEISLAKGDHLRENWQDNGSAKCWNKAGRLLIGLAAKVDELV